MPSVRRRRYRNDPAIFADSNYTSGNNITIDGSGIQVNATSTEKEVRAGMFVCKVGNDFRYLPRTDVTAGATTSEAVITVDIPEVFKVGDVLYPVELYALITLGGTIASTESMTITISGVTNTFVSTSTSLDAMATGLVNAINNHPITKQLVRAVANASTIWIYGLDGISNYSVAVAENSASGTITITTGGAALVVPNTAIGTISSINMTNDRITLTANAAIAVPVGMKIGVRIDDFYGLDVSSRNFTDFAIAEIATYECANAVRTQFLPYLDGDVRRRLPRMKFAEKF
jgi:hypothetical protein